MISLLNPLMPFVTEALWESLAPGEADRLIGRRWPDLAGLTVDPDARDEMGWVVRLITEIRAMRSEMNVPAGASIAAFLKDPALSTVERLDRHRPLITRLARLETIAPLAGEVPVDSAQDVLDEATLVLPLAGVIDLDRERARLSREIGKWDAEIGKLDKKLANRQFLAKAPADVVEAQRERRAQFETSRDRLKEALARITPAA